MKKLLQAVLLSSLTLAPLAVAEEIDYLVRVNRFETTAPGSGNTRIVSTAIIDNPDFVNQGGTILISFGLVNQTTEEQLFSGSASISSNQTQVITGNNQTGRIELTYDSTLNRLEARFSRNITPGQRYLAVINHASWSGRGEIISGIVF